MNDQLTLFEPAGAELAKLAQGHYKKAETLGRIADTLEARGFTSSVKAFEFDSLREMREAVICETALQCESLAGLVEPYRPKRVIQDLGIGFGQAAGLV